MHGPLRMYICTHISDPSTASALWYQNSVPTPKATYSKVNIQETFGPDVKVLEPLRKIQASEYIVLVTQYLFYSKCVAF